MSELYGVIGQKNYTNLLADPQGADVIGIPCEPGNGDLTAGMLVYRKSSGLYAPAGSGQISTSYMLAVLKEQSTRLDKLAQDILSLARIEHLEDGGEKRDFAVCDLSDVMKNVFTLMRPKAAAQGVGLVLLRNDRLRIACDAARIEEAVQNLVENALRYSGSLTVELSLEAEGGRARISVVDRAHRHILKKIHWAKKVKLPTSCGMQKCDLVKLLLLTNSQKK